MIKLLRVENLILIESATIPFEVGLNILSGETGAGKSAIMQALRLIAGEKGDPKVIRHEATKAVVEALFEPAPHSPVWALLEKAGLSLDPLEPLLIRRELPLSGKSRAFINNQLAAVPLLKEMGEYLFDIASQHASQKLSSDAFQRSIVDTWGDLLPEISIFTKSFIEETALEEELHKLVTGEAARIREIEARSREIEEIEEARLDPTEEEEIFKEYSELAMGEERYQLVEEALQGLTHLPLNPLKHTLASLVEKDVELKPLSDLFLQAKAELEEVSWGLGQYQGKIPFNQGRMSELNSRLKVITKLKKKYGSSIPAILEWLEQQKEHLDTLSSSEERIGSIKEALTLLTPLNDKRAAAITFKRTEQALKLSELITKELHALNMAKAEFYIEVKPQERSKMGQDHVTFLFQPNVGGKKISVKEAASGGELARILLSIKTLIAEKEEPSCLVFDEVDANIGGETARLLGIKLAALGQTTQVIAITHFPQVAEHADHHLSVRKMEVDGKTTSIIELLSPEMRHRELSRMVGGRL